METTKTVVKNLTTVDGMSYPKAIFHGSREELKNRINDEAGLIFFEYSDTYSTHKRELAIRVECIISFEIAAEEKSAQRSAVASKQRLDAIAQAAAKIVPFPQTEKEEAARQSKSACVSQKSKPENHEIDSIHFTQMSLEEFLKHAQISENEFIKLMYASNYL